MERFKVRAIVALSELQAGANGLIRSTINDCVKVLEGIPDDEHSGEKACGPNYEAECKLLREQLAIMGDERDKLELLLKEAEMSRFNLQSRIDRLEGFREGVILGINARNRMEAAKELRNCCNRMEDMNYE